MFTARPLVVVLDSSKRRRRNLPEATLGDHAECLAFPTGLQEGTWCGARTRFEISDVFVLLSARVD